MRVQIPAYTDHYIMGDRYGEVVKVWRKPGMRYGMPQLTNYYRVKLDKSGKHVVVDADDCKEVD